uniref:Uncharacterized protein n=1 Tax=Aegilops tauschii subsp. strangulata TaxID=200361 RepID=A0A453BW11_AEGTS
QGPNSGENRKIPIPTMDPDVETLADDDALAGDGGEADRFEAEAEAELLRDRFRLAVINIATSEGKKAGMEVAGPVIACIADLAFKSAGSPKSLPPFAAFVFTTDSALFLISIWPILDRVLAWNRTS